MLLLLLLLLIVDRVWSVVVVVVAEIRFFSMPVAWKAVLLRLFLMKLLW